MNLFYAPFTTNLQFAWAVGENLEVYSLTSWSSLH